MTIIKPVPKNKRVGNLIMSIVLLTLSIGLIKSSFEVFKGTQRMKDLEKEVLDLQNKKKELEASIEYKKTAEYIEEKARNDLNLIKPGETIYVISGLGNEDYLQKNVLSSTSKNSGKATVKDNNWYKWYRLFF
jgi:cell division protein FtsB